eukprot:CAMPEP_0175004842 /NCGR_PEP_ID=MMETSP0005-20121125/4985_1 /TAXON_ID=420556 /ORGANISM="Ochromonas sp., Strain CCMP1393" /LENGTH=244 /DNA_ID=CAMNT_0016260027 /DNA_START=3 /DNA_END=737 /DNA_ORIENTATION=-
MESKTPADGMHRDEDRRHSGFKDDAEGRYVGAKAESKSDAVIENRGAKVDSDRSSRDSSRKEERSVLREIRQDIEADEEFESLKNTPTQVAPVVAASKVGKSFAKGFNINSMNMRDATNGRLMWRSTNWDPNEMFVHEVQEQITKDILQCRAVSREIVFSSALRMDNFRLEQRVYFHGNCIEQWFFKFGCVIPGSVNTWQQTIDAAPPSEMIPAEELSGNVVFETSFYDGEEFLCKNSVRIFYV